MCGRCAEGKKRGVKEWSRFACVRRKKKEKEKEKEEGNARWHKQERKEQCRYVNVHALLFLPSLLPFLLSLLEFCAFVWHHIRRFVFPFRMCNCVIIILLMNSPNKG
jgi:hypothetical protein